MVDTAISEMKRRAAAVRHSPESYARSIARRWPHLDPETRRRILTTLAPVIGGDQR